MPIDNVMAVTIYALMPHCPAEWASFGELYGKLAANAKQHRHEVFFLIGDESKAQDAVCLAAINHVMNTRGHALGAWIIAMLKAMKHPTVCGLEELFKTCPDRTLLPLAPDDPVMDLLGMEQLKEAADVSTEA